MLECNLLNPYLPPLSKGAENRGSAQAYVASGSHAQGEECTSPQIGYLRRPSAANFAERQLHDIRFLALNLLLEPCSTQRRRSRNALGHRREARTDCGRNLCYLRLLPVATRSA